MNEVAIVGLVILFIALAVIIAVSVAISRNSRRIGSYSATVYDKEIRNTMIYAGVFVPMALYILKVDMGIEVQVDHKTFNRIEIGESIQIARYSNGKYKLEH